MCLLHQLTLLLSSQFAGFYHLYGIIIYQTSIKLNCLIHPLFIAETLMWEIFSLVAPLFFCVDIEVSFSSFWKKKVLTYGISFSPKSRQRFALLLWPLQWTWQSYVVFLYPQPFFIGINSKLPPFNLSMKY